MSKRTFLGTAAAAVGALITGCSRKQGEATPGTFEVERSSEEWRRRLTPAQYQVLREAGTERNI